MNRTARLVSCGVLGLTLAGATACESTSYGVGMSYSSGYYPGYPGYAGYPGYWYDDDRPIVVAPPGNRPGGPTTLPAQLPSTGPSMPSTRPAASTRSTSTMSRPATRSTPRPARRGR